MIPKNQSPEISESDQILHDLVQKTAHFPQEDRELILQDIHRLEVILNENKQALFESERLRQEEPASNQNWRERFTILADNSPLLIWMTDPQGGNLYINQTYQEYIGVSIDQVRGLNWQYYLHPDDAPAYIEAFQNAIRERKDFHIEARVRRTDGTWRWLTHHAKPHFTGDGVYLGHVGNSMDITDRKQAEDELRKTIETLRESERIYRAIGEAIDYGVWICEPDGRNRYASQSYLDLLGITQQQCSDFGWGNSLHPDDAERTIAAWKECVRAGGTWDIEHRFRGKDGRYHPILARGVPVRNEHGEIICWAGINLDINRLKQSEGYQRALNEIGQAMHSTLDTGEILRRSISAAAAALGSDSATISLRKEGRWIISAVHGLSEEMLGIEMDDTQERHAVLAIQTKMPVAVNDAFNDERFNREHLRKWGIRSVLVMPIVVKDEAIGVMFFNYQKSSCSFNQSHIDFVSQLASSLSLALENSRLFKDLQEEIAERKQAEAALEKALIEVENEKNRLLAVMEALPIGLAFYDKDGGDITANHGYEEIWGSPRPAVHSIDDYPLYQAWWADSGEPLQPDEWASARAFQKGETVAGQVIEVRGFDGRHRIVLNSGAPIRDAQGQIAGAAVAVMDITESRQMEQALAFSERKYRELVQYAPTAIYEIDFRTLRFTAMNDAMVAMSGYSHEELLQMNPFDLLTEPSRAILEERTRQWVSGMQPDNNVEYQIKTKDGRVIYAILNTTFNSDENGNPISASVIAHDITERKQAEEAIRESESKFHAVFQNAPFGILLARQADSVIVDVNPAWTQLFGFEREETLGRTVLELRITPDAEVYQQAKAELRNNGYLRNLEYTSRTKKGDTVIISINTELVTIQGTTYTLNTMENITERKQAEDELRRSEITLRESEAHLRESTANERARANELEAVMDAAPAVIWISRDPECREMIGNRYSYDFLNIRQGENVSKTAPKEAVGVQKYHMEKNGCSIPVSELPMQIAAATGKPAKDYTFDLVYQDGTVFHMFGNVNPLLDADGKPYGAIGVFVDLTTLRRLEEEQISAKAEIEVQRRLMDQREQERMIIARDLHDGPIQTLSGSVFHLQMVKEVFTDPALLIELNQIGMDIKNTIHEIREVLNDLRPPALMHFGFTRMVQMYTEDIRERFADIDIELDVMDDNKVLSDEARLALFRIYQAAINNIVRHSGASKAWVIFKLSPDSFLLELRDDGKGFEMTQDFTQLTRAGHFGLVGMKERAEAIGGEFSVASEPGSGTVIVVKGPLLGKNLM